MCKWPARCLVEQSPIYLHNVKEVSLCFVCAHLYLKIEVKRKKKKGSKKGKQKVLRGFWLVCPSVEFKTMVKYSLFVGSNSYIMH